MDDHKTHCKRGHEYTAENTRHGKSGSAVCRACQKIRMEAFKMGKPSPPIYKSVEEGFWAKVDKSPGHGPWGDCWNWTAYKNKNGYGKFMLEAGTKSVRAARFAYISTHGQFDPALSVCHRCDNPPCVNPRHLFLGSHQDNMDDMTAKGRRIIWNTALTHCKRGHEFVSAGFYTTKAGTRQCKACIGIRRAGYRESRKKAAI